MRPRLFAIGCACGFVLLVFWIPAASAHGGESGPIGKQYVEKTAGDRLVRFGVDSAQLIRGSDVQVDVSLLDRPEDHHWIFTPYDRVTLTILRNGSVVSEHEGAFSPIGPTYFAFRFERGGVHALHVRFEKDGAVVAESELPLSVAGSIRTGRVVAIVSTYIQVMMVLAFLVFLAVHFFDQKTHSPAAA